jgi:hypothetical protein
MDWSTLGINPDYFAQLEAANTWQQQNPFFGGGDSGSGSYGGPAIMNPLDAIMTSDGQSIGDFGTKASAQWNPETNSFSIRRRVDAPGSEGWTDDRKYHYETANYGLNEDKSLLSQQSPWDQQAVDSSWMRTGPTAMMGLAGVLGAGALGGAFGGFGGAAGGGGAMGMGDAIGAAMSAEGGLGAAGAAGMGGIGGGSLFGSGGLLSGVGSAAGMLGLSPGQLLGGGLGLLAGMDSTKDQKTSSTQRMDPRMDALVYGQGGFLPQAQQWFQNAQNSPAMGLMNQGAQMQAQHYGSPQYAQQFGQLRDAGMGLLGRPMAGNPFMKG